MESTCGHSSEESVVYDWRAAGLRYYSYNFHLRQKYGYRVQRVSIDAGFTCPNVDGTITTGGCNFCDNRSFSPSRRVRRQNIIDQIDDGISRLKRRYDCDHFTRTFSPPRIPMRRSSVCGQFTRPRCRIRKSSAWRSARAPTVSRTTSSTS